MSSNIKNKPFLDEFIDYVCFLNVTTPNSIADTKPPKLKEIKRFFKGMDLLFIKENIEINNRPKIKYKTPIKLFEIIEDDFEVLKLCCDILFKVMEQPTDFVPLSS